LARHPHINFVKDDGRSPLAAAIAIGNEMANDILWRHNADPHVADKAGNTLLLACAGPSILILKHILEHCSEVTMHNLAGETAVHLASVASKYHFRTLQEGGNRHSTGLLREDTFDGGHYVG
jgi:ankyrin repeat protein